MPIRSKHGTPLVGAPKTQTSQDRALHYLKQMNADYFNFFRAGKAFMWDEDDRRADIKKLVIGQTWPPFRGHSKETTDKLLARATRNASTYRVAAFNQLRQMARLANQDAEIRESLNTAARKAWKAGLRFHRVLGCGGNGLAALFEAKNSRGKTLKVVCKMSYSDDNPSIEREKFWGEVCLPTSLSLPYPNFLTAIIC
jgi:hypothetical protein